MSQLPYLRHDDLGPDGRAVWESVVSTRGDRVIDENGHLTGPFNTLLHAPGIGIKVSELGAALRYHSTLPANLLELAVITVAAHWHAEFEWYAHASLASAAGVSDEVISAISAGDEPESEFDHDGERVVHTAARQLVNTGHLDRSIWAEADQLLGDQGLVELVNLVGYYTSVSFGLNAFDIPLPAGVTPQWGG